MRKMLINTQERAVSTDINRLQSFAVHDACEALRMRYLGLTSGPESPYGDTYPTTVNSPLLAEILGGFQVRPVAGTFNLTVDGGSLVCINPSNLPDDSVAITVHDPGSALVILPNSSGSTRIDVIECRVNPVPSIVTDNRDIFDATSGLFVATTVTKETGDRLEYRVRQGTPGSGMPANQSGWLPLCVAKVPNSASSVDSCDFWDVRPMIDDWDAPARGIGLTNLVQQQFTGTRVSSASYPLTGTYRARMNGRRYGGPISKSMPTGTWTLGTFDVYDSANQDSAITEPVTGHVYIYAIAPFGLPRWAYYQRSPGTRYPIPGGMLVASYVKPQTASPIPSSPITIPTSTGLGGTVSGNQAVCVGVIPAGSTQLIGFASTDKNANFALSSKSNGNTAYASGVITFGTVPDTFWPPNAKRAKLQLNMICDVPNGTQISGNCILRIYEATKTRVVTIAFANISTVSNHSGSTKSPIVFAQFDIPLPNFDVGPFPLQAEVQLGSGVFPALYGTDITFTSATLGIVGLQL